MATSTKQIPLNSFGSAQNIICVPIGVGIAGKVAETGELINCPDAYDHPDFQSEIDKSTGFRTKSVLCIPVENHEKDGGTSVIGIVQAINRVNSKGAIVPFNDEDIKLMKLFCGQLSVVMRQMMTEAQFTKIAVDRRSAMNRKSSTAVPVFALASEYRTKLENETKYNTFGDENDAGWSVPEREDKIQLKASERSERAFEEDEHTRDESREMAADIMATSTTKLTLFHSIRLARLFRSFSIKNAPRFARRSVEIPALK